MLHRLVLCAGHARNALSLMSLALVLAACGLPEADGTEATIAEKAAGLTSLAPGQGHDAPDVVRTGLILHPSVREAASEVSASADQVRVQRAALFPSLGLSVGGGVGAGGDGDPALQLTGRQLLMDFGDTRRAVTSADIDLQMNYINFQLIVDDAIVELLLAYDAVRLYDQLLTVRRKQFAAMQELETLVTERTDSGASASSDLLETRKRMQSAEFLVHDTELALAEARDRLARLSGQTKGGAVSVKSGTCTSGAGSDEMRLAQLRLVKSEIDLVRAEKAKLPRAILSPLARSQVDDGGVRLGLNVGVDSDLLSGGAHTARANAARNSRDGARAGVEAAALNSDLDERKLQRDIAAGGRKTEMLRRQIDLLSETRSLYRDQYFHLGTRQLSDLLENEEEYYDSQAELSEVGSALVANRLQCATRDGSLRQQMGLDGNSLYGFPLSNDAL